MIGGSSAAGGGDSSVGGAGSSTAGEGGSSTIGGGVTGSLVAGGASVEGTDGSLGVAGWELSIAGIERSSEDGEGVGVLLGVGMTAGKSADEPSGIASCAALKPAPITPSRTFCAAFCTASLPPSIRAAACSSTCSAAPGRTRSTNSSGSGLSESGANQVSKETTTTTAASTPAPADNEPRLWPPRRRGRRAGAFSSRPSFRTSFRTSLNTVGPASPSRRPSRTG